MAAEPVKKIGKGKSENDIYTALLGLTVLVLGATAVLVCLRGLELFDAFI